MATTITAGNATNGAIIVGDNTGILELKTGTGSGTTGLTINASQNATFAGTLSAGAITSSGLVTGTTGALYPLVSGTAITLTNQTAPEFTSIPPWAKRITLTLVGVSRSSTGVILIQIGSGSYSTSNYLSSCGAINAGVAQSGSTSGLAISTQVPAANTVSGAITLSLLGSNQWASSGNMQYSTTVGAMLVTGGHTPALSGALDRLRLYIDGTQFFDAGTINLLWE